MLANIEYKCRRCGAVDRSIKGAHELALKAILSAITDTYLPEGGIPVTMFSTHLCEDGGAGVSDLLGYSLDEKDNVPPDQE